MKDSPLARIVGVILMVLPIIFFLGFCVATFLLFLLRQPWALVFLAVLFGSGLAIYRFPDRSDGPN